ncbi:MAG TPA: hypothetical protein DDX98_03180, partial [Bacteroidales bacterium]|nr:hypothetical protein [Bacteroidales bacterium]
IQTLLKSRKMAIKGEDTRQLKETGMEEKKVKVNGMTCNHCKMNVETNLKKLEGIDAVEVNLDTQGVTLIGNNIDLEKVKKTVESIGYKFEN